VDLAVAAIEDVLDGRMLIRDELHEDLRQRLPQALLPWCRGCQSHHARRGLLVMAALRGRLCISGRAGRQPVFGRTDQLTGWDPPPREEASSELVRRYLSAYGPSTPAHFATWAGIGNAHAKELWSLVKDELEPVGKQHVLARDKARLDDPPPAEGVRLLGYGDPLLLGRDREPLVPDPALRKKAWAPIGGLGLVLAGGRPVALWRPRKQGTRLQIEVDAFGKVPRKALAAEAERLAPYRGCDSVSIAYG
jgi:hypothetical protein